jgi:hypothetical protein
VAEELFGSEGGFVEVDGFGSVADGEHGAIVVFGLLVSSEEWLI